MIETREQYLEQAQEIQGIKIYVEDAGIIVEMGLSARYAMPFPFMWEDVYNLIASQRR